MFAILNNHHSCAILERQITPANKIDEGRENNTQDSLSSPSSHLYMLYKRLYFNRVTLMKSREKGKQYMHVYIHACI